MPQPFNEALVFLMLAPVSMGQTVFNNPPMDSGQPAVSVEALQPVLDRDLKEAFTTGALAPATGRGVVVGVVQHGVRRVFAYGPVQKDSIFEIGSITKTFTGLVLAQLAVQGKVRIEDPVRTLLPAGVVTKPDGAEITLLDLTTQHSGISSNPDNLHPADPANPFADYGSQDLYAFLRKRGVAHSPDTAYGYSNTGVKLLAQALSVRAGLSYPELLRQQITGPLGMTDTQVAVDPSKKARIVQGHNAEHQPVPAWTFSDLPGAGGIHSTAEDMLAYLDAQLHPERLHAAGDGASLPEAIPMTHVIRNIANPGMHIAMNWFQADADGNYQHGGRTGGFIAYAVFNPTRDFGVIVLSNTAGSQESFAVRLADHVAQRLAGQPALSLIGTE